MATARRSVSRRSFLTASAAAPMVGVASLPGVLDRPTPAPADAAELFMVESPQKDGRDPWIDCLTESESIARERLDSRLRHPSPDPPAQLRELRAEFEEGDCYIVMAQTFCYVWEDGWPTHVLDLPDTMPTDEDGGNSAESHSSTLSRAAAFAEAARLNEIEMGAYEATQAAKKAVAWFVVWQVSSPIRDASWCVSVYSEAGHYEAHTHHAIRLVRPTPEEISRFAAKSWKWEAVA